MTDLRKRAGVQFSYRELGEILNIPGRVVGVIDQRVTDGRDALTVLFEDEALQPMATPNIYTPEWLDAPEWPEE